MRSLTSTRQAVLLPASFFLLLTFQIAFAQNSALVDSLERVLPTSKGADRASVLYELVYIYMRTDNEKAVRYKQQLQQELAENSDPKAAPYIYMGLGIYHARTGKLDSGLFYLRHADTTAQKAANVVVRLKNFVALGNAYISSGRPGTALEVMFEGLKILQSHPDMEMEMKLRTNIAWAYLELKQYRNCIDFGLENIRKMEGTKFEWIVLYTYNNVAVSYGALGKLDSAEFYIKKALKAAEKSGDMQSMANGHFILGTVFSNAGKYDLAIAQYLKAKPYREKVGNPFFLVSDLYAMSELYYKLGDYKNGVKTGREALELAEKYNLLLKFESTYLTLAQNYEALNDFKNSSRFYRLWAMAKDTVYKNANAEAIAEMKTRYETEAKEQQLQVQRAQLASKESDLQRTYVIIAALVIMLVLVVIIFMLIRSRQEKLRQVYLREAQIQATIQSQETERRRFAQDLHDGMGQLISALRLSLHTIDKSTPLEERVNIVGRAEKLLNEMHMEIRSIAFNLMPQALVQNGLVAALREMASRINQSGKVTVRLISFDLPERLPEIQEISLYRVLQEWVNNVIKYADPVVIEIQLLGYEDEISIVVEDDGKGFDTTVLEHSGGNGWRNIKSRLNLIKASYDIDSTPGHKGTTLILTVPVLIQDKAGLRTSQ